MEKINVHTIDAEEGTEIWHNEKLLGVVRVISDGFAAVAGSDASDEGGRYLNTFDSFKAAKKDIVEYYELSQAD